MLRSWVFVVLAGVVLLLGIGIAWIVYRDAGERGTTRVGSLIWALGAMTVAPLILPLYVVYIRGTERERPLSQLETAVLWTWLSIVGSFLLGAMVSPPDPFTISIYAIAMFPPVALVVYWALPAGGYRRLLDHDT